MQGPTDIFKKNNNAVTDLYTEFDYEWCLVPGHTKGFSQDLMIVSLGKILPANFW